MAGLTGTGGGERSAARAGRGQLLLTAGVVIALLLVTLSLSLNAAIFTENAGARGSGDSGGHDAVQYRADAGSMAERTLEHVNGRHNDTYTTLHRALSADVRTWSDLSGRHEAVTGGTVNASVRETTNGTHVRQTASRVFTDMNGGDNWTLVHGAEGVREFSLSVEPGSLAEPETTNTTANLTDAGVFRIDVETDTAARRVFVYRKNTEFVVATESGTGQLGDTCEVTAGTFENVRMNLTEGTMNGASCGELAFFGDTAESRTIGYEAASNASGTYSLIVDTNYGDVYDASYGDEPTNNGPYATEMIYSADVGLTYVTHKTTYRTTVSAVPGGPDDD